MAASDLRVRIAMAHGVDSLNVAAAADPVALLPTGVRTVLIHGDADEPVPLSQSQTYLAAARAAGDDCTLEVYRGGHFEHLDPSSDAVALLRRALTAIA
jgi:pimeloyl-ACP methyl ester carboxylesterase